MLSNPQLPAWELKRSRRTRRLWVRVQRDGSVTVTAPFFAPLATIERFVSERAAWIVEAVRRTARFKDDSFLPRDRRTYVARREEARALVHGLLAEYAPRYAFGSRYKKVFIKNLRRNWGSCSEHANLNFNYKLVFLPRELAAYVVVHELCHLERFDHSPAFWALVAQQMPEHRAMRRALKKYHL